MLHRAGSRRIVVAGGDGSLHAVVAALHRRHELTGKTLALLPLGTGNDFARGTGIPLDIEDAARLVLDGEPRPVDLIVDETGEIVVNNVHVGAGAQASRKGHTWKYRLGSIGVGRLNLGKLGYPIGALLAAVNPPSHRLRVEVDGEVVIDVDQPRADGRGRQRRQRRRRHRAHPGGRPRERHAGRDDRAAPSPPTAKLGYVGAPDREGEHHERDDVLYLRGREVSVRGEEFWVSADGEIYGPERSRTWRLERCGVRHGAAPASSQSQPRGRPRRRPGSGCPRPGRSSARRCGAARSAG